MKTDSAPDVSGNPWLAAARSVIEHGPVTPDETGLFAHFMQHPSCAVAGQHETVYTRCCGTPIALGRPMWACEIPSAAGLLPDCCARPWAMFGDPA